MKSAVMKAEPMIVSHQSCSVFHGYGYVVLTIRPLNLPGVAGAREGEPLTGTIVGKFRFRDTERVPLGDISLSGLDGVGVHHVDESQQTRGTDETNRVIYDTHRICV